LASQDVQLPPNVRLAQGARVTGLSNFKRFLSQQEGALSVGERSVADGVTFAVGAQGRIAIGRDCYFNECILLAEQEIRIGNYVMIGWNTTISDSDFHPLDPAERIKDAIALSPLGDHRERPHVTCRPVVIGDDVYIGPACTILKGITIGAGAFVEPGSVVTRDVPDHARVRGNPAAIVAPDEDE